MTASFALNFILQLCFALVCLSLLCPFSPAASLNFTPSLATYSGALLARHAARQGYRFGWDNVAATPSFRYRRAEQRWDLRFMWTAAVFQRAKMRDSGACFDDTTPARPYD